jgi:Flp pilus assembly protein TadG
MKSLFTSYVQRRAAGSSERRGAVAFVRNDRGAVTLMFAVMGGMLVLGMSAMLSVLEFGWSQSRMQNAADVANLAIGVNASHYSSLSGSALAAQLQTDALNYYKANAQGDGIDSSVTSSNFIVTVTGTPATGQTIKLTVTGTLSLFVPTTVASSFNQSGKAVIGTTTTAGQSTVQLTVTNTVLRLPQSTLELVMVLDNTGSMSQAAASGSSTSKMTGLKAAANTLIDDLLTTTSVNTYIGLVPFASTVNVKNALSSSGSWLSQSFSYNSTGVNMANWGGCVAEPRAASTGYMYPQPYTPNTTPKFTPYYYNVPPTGLVTRDYSRSTGKNGNGSNGTLCTNNYNTSTVYGVPLGGTLTLSNGIPNYCGYSGDGVGNGITYYWDTSSSYNLYDESVSQNTDCIAAPVTFLTSNSSTLKTAINNMTASGSTIIPTGVLWGWRMLSSTWSQAIAGTGNGWVNSDTSFPKPETTTGLQRVMVVLTDGENDVGVQYLAPNDLYFNGLSGVGNATLTAPTVVRTDGTTMSNGRMDAIELHGNALQSGGVGWPDDINTFQLAACTAMKNSGITIYAITFGTVSDVAAATMQSCATTGNYYHAPDNASLNTIFNQIAGNLGILRLTQ